MSTENFLQLEQDKVELEITIINGKSWEEYLQETITLNDTWAEICGAREVPRIVTLRKEAEVNAVSFERCVLNDFLNKGYSLEELAVHFNAEDKAPWGVSHWQKAHRSYDDADYIKQWPGLDKKWLGFVKSIFQTEHAGEQTFTLFSMQMVAAQMLGLHHGVLLHKTLVFHKATFSLPAMTDAAAA